VKRGKGGNAKRGQDERGEGGSTVAEFRSFEGLTVWKLARAFRHRIYRVSETWPKREMYGLTAQIRDAAVSVTANIAEGYGRYHYRENMQLCRIARGSVNEVLDHLYTAVDERYIPQETFDELYAQGREVERVLNGYINYLKRQLRSKKEEREKVEERKVVREAVVLYGAALDYFEWEGGVEWVYDYETGFDIGWAA
jgi:four helix bundle protein